MHKTFTAPEAGRFKHSHCGSYGIHLQLPSASALGYVEAHRFGGLSVGWAPIPSASAQGYAEAPRFGGLCLCERGTAARLVEDRFAVSG